jgi:hypothetical protein
MFHRLIRRSLLVLALGLVLGSSAASASALNRGNFLTEGITDTLSGLLARALGLPGTLKLGCSISPDGSTICAPKHGCSISPDGKPVCGQKHGCSIDPDGRAGCLPIVTPKLGCSINPDGHTVCAP